MISAAAAAATATSARHQPATAICSIFLHLNGAYFLFSCNKRMSESVINTILYSIEWKRKTPETKCSQAKPSQVKFNDRCASDLLFFSLCISLCLQTGRLSRCILSSHCLRMRAYEFFSVSLCVFFFFSHRHHHHHHHLHVTIHKICFLGRMFPCFFCFFFCFFHTFRRWWKWDVKYNMPRNVYSSGFKPEILTHTHTLTPEGKQKIKLANSLYKKKI